MDQRDEVGLWELKCPHKDTQIVTNQDSWLQASAFREKLMSLTGQFEDIKGYANLLKLYFQLFGSYYTVSK